MSEDRALDIRIGQEVFGYAIENDADGPRYVTSGSSAFTGRRLPRYSNDIAAAWLVVCEMRKQDRYHGFCWSLHHEIGYDERVPEDLGWLLLERDATEVAALICRGALRAIAEPSVLDRGGAARMNAALETQP